MIKVTPISSGLKVSANKRVKQWDYYYTEDSGLCNTNSFINIDGPVPADKVTPDYQQSKRQNFTIYFDHQFSDPGIAVNYGQDKWPNYCLQMTDTSGTKYHYRHMIDKSFNPDHQLIVSQHGLSLTVYHRSGTTHPKSWRWHSQKSDFDCSSKTGFSPGNGFSNLDRTPTQPPIGNAYLSTYGLATLNFNLDPTEMGHFYCLQMTDVTNNTYYRKYRIETVPLVETFVDVDPVGNNLLTVKTAMPINNFSWIRTKGDLNCNKDIPLSRMTDGRTTFNGWSSFSGDYHYRLLPITDHGNTYCFRVVDTNNKVYYHKHKIYIRLIAFTIQDGIKIRFDTPAQAIKWRWSVSQLDSDCDGYANFTNESQSDPLIITAPFLPEDSPDGRSYTYCIEADVVGRLKQHQKYQYSNKSQYNFAQVEGLAKLRLVSVHYNLRQLGYIKLGAGESCGSSSDFGVSKIINVSLQSNPIEINLAGDDGGKFYCFRIVDYYDRVEYQKYQIKPTIVARHYRSSGKASFLSLGQASTWTYKKLGDVHTSCNSQTLAKTRPVSRRSLWLSRETRTSQDVYCIKMTTTDNYTQYLKYIFPTQ